MTDSELTTWIKRLILNARIASTTLTEAKTDAINLLANALVAAEPEYFEKKTSLTHGGTHIYTVPTDSIMVKKIWDYDGNAASVSGAADNGSGLVRLTHDGTIADEDRITVHDVAGTTEANGTWKATYVDSTHVDLYGSTYANTYTSGGKIYIEESDTYKYPIERMPSNFEDADDETYFIQREDDIIINDPDFENDIIILYRYLPSSLTEIPARMHFGIYAYAALALVELPSPTIQVGDGYSQNPDYETLKKNISLCEMLLERALKMASNFSPIKPTNNISDRKSVKRWL